MTKMDPKFRTSSNTEHAEGDGLETNWLSWCRLCAKRELNDKENLSIFGTNCSGKLGSELATSIGKYFWVNIKADDAISHCLCSECRQLVEELVVFTERVNKVQTLFCLLQNIKPTNIEQAEELRKQCGIIDEGYQHIIKTDTPKMIKSAKSLCNDQQTQTDSITATENEKETLNDMQTTIETEEIINILRKSENQTDIEMEAENVYEFVMQSENEMEYLDNNEYVVPSNNEDNEDKQSITETTANDEDLQDADLFRELKYKVSSDENDDHKETETFQIVSKTDEEDLEYQQVEEEEIEMLEEEDDEDYIDISEDHPEVPNNESFGLQKGKRGRPFGTKNSQTDASPYRFVCKDCKRTYKNPNIFRKHMRTMHNFEVDDLPDFKSNSNTCEVCNKQFLTRSSLKLHMRHHLPDEEKYNVPCPYCDRKFSQVGAMRQHVNGIHHQMKPFICDQCGRACKTMAALNEHQLVHTNECPFECEVCQKRFKNKPRLKSHMDIHNKSVYSCPDCGLELNTKRTLLQHRLVHSDIKRYKCEFCDAAFKRSKALKNHLILHSGLRPYKCNFCSKSFSNGSNFRAHKKRAHPKELAAEEASGIEPERVPIPKLEELKSAKGILVQPRKIKRHPGGLPHHLRKLLESSEKCKEKNLSDCDNAGENYESLSDFHYEICKSEIDETESMVDNPNEECEETVIYEIIDEI